MESLSEPAGAFDVSDNLVSNEPYFVENVRRLRRTGGVYVGVGPEQNFSYIARLQPAMAFIVDIRRENRNLHLLYKALFELSADRADFVSRLFSRPRPDGLGPATTVEAIFTRFENMSPSSEIYEWNLALVRDRLLKKGGFALSDDDMDSIGRALKAFDTDGPGIHFWGSRTVDGSALRPSYRKLMTAVDATGQERSFLATEAAFSFVRELHAKNTIVPIVGDFGGPTAIRRVAEYVRRHAEVVEAFYGSNVGVYLNKEQTRAFCGNLAALPAARKAAFIEPDGIRSLHSKVSSCRPRVDGAANR